MVENELSDDMAVIVWTLKCLYGCVHVIYHDRTSQIAENQKWSILPQTALIPWKTLKISALSISRMMVPHIFASAIKARKQHIWENWELQQIVLYILGSSAEWSAMGQSRSVFKLKKVNRWGNFLLSITGNLTLSVKMAAALIIFLLFFIFLSYLKANALLGCGTKQALVPWWCLGSMQHLLTTTKKLLTWYQKVK